jgi:hypothetical protein
VSAAGDADESMDAEGSTEVEGSTDAGRDGPTVGRGVDDPVPQAAATMARTAARAKARTAGRDGCTGGWTSIDLKGRLIVRRPGGAR